MKSDFIIIGSGLAGLTSALTLAHFGTVLLVSKGKLNDSATNLAQGGIAAVVDEKDSFGSHIRDTIYAGAGQSDEKAVKYLVEHGPDAIVWLEDQGVEFDRGEGKFKLGQEGAHSTRRVLHATDFTGNVITQKLIQKVKTIDNIAIWENSFLIDLLVQDDHCYGVQIIKKDKIINCFSRVTILATGGLGQLYFKTTNPKNATGDGIAAGYRAGARVKDLEFIQFHPTALDYGNSPLFLLSEAVRGEGAYLINEKGKRFMEKKHPLKELAPRDILAREILLQLQNGAVYLDIRHKKADFLRERFPQTFEYLLKLGFDLSRDLLPVTPAAHYSCGGLAVDLLGRTEIQNLFAFGEVSCTGVHGGNRLASNSLLEAIVFPLQLPRTIKLLPQEIIEKEFPSPVSDKIKSLPERYKKTKQQLQQLMWNYVGIIRTREGLHFAKRELMRWNEAFEDEKSINREIIELKNMLTTALLITEMALLREESLGAHYLES